MALFFSVHSSDWLYRKDKNDEKLKLAFLRGWSLPTIEILVDVISFYQVVIGPVRSSSSLFTGHSWQSTEIQYGNKLRLDGDVAAGNDLMSRKFESIMQDLGIDFWWLQTTNADDLIFKLAKGGEDEDSPS